MKTCSSAQKRDRPCINRIDRSCTRNSARRLNGHHPRQRPVEPGMLHQPASLNYGERPHKALLDDLLVKFDSQSRIGGQSPCAVFEMKFRPGEPGAQYGGK